MAKNKITVIIPVYNVEKFLRDCLDSVINQTYKNLEIICVNDGSTDSSPEILKEYKAKDDRIVIVNKANGGLASARNAGLNAATGDFVAFLDSDDWISNNFCTELLKAIIKTHSDAAIAQTFYVYKDKIAKNDYVNYYTHKISRTRIISKIKDKQNLVYSCACWNKLYKRSIIEKYHLRFTEGLNIEDFPFNFAYILVASKFCLVNKAVLYYRQREDSIMVKAKSNRIPFDVLKNYEECRKHFLALTKYMPKKKEYNKILDNFIINNAYAWLKATQKEYTSEFFEKTKKLYGNIKIQNNHYINKQAKFIYNTIMSNINAQEAIDAIENQDTDDFYYKIRKYKESRIVFWGASLFLKKCLNSNSFKDFNIICIVDKDKNKQGKTFDKYTILPPEKINELKPDVVILTVKHGHKRIHKILKQNWNIEYPNVVLAPDHFDKIFTECN